MKIGNEPFLSAARAPRPQALQQDPLYQCADQLLASREIPLQDHLLLRENVASYLSQMDPQLLTDQQKLGQAISEQSRWGYKVHRELDHPYTDQQVFQHLDDLEDRCRQLASSTYPKGLWYVSGSIPKGRFGANSDVDLTCDGGFRPGQIDSLNKQPGWDAGEFKVEFQSGDPQLIHGSAHLGEDLSAVLVTGDLLTRKLSEYDAQVPLELQVIQSQHGFLSDIYVQGLGRKGYQVSRQDGDVQVTVPVNSPSRSPEKVWQRPGQ